MTESVKTTYPHECLRCGRKWDARVEFPSFCPTCKSHNFDKPKDEVFGNIVRPKAFEKQ